MKSLKVKKRLAAKVLKVGTNRVWFDPSRLNEIKEAITKQDIKDLIKEGAIKKKPKIGIRKIKKKIRKKRKRGEGSIKKHIKKRDYPKRIRKIRNFLKKLKKENKISNKQYQKARLLAKAGIIRKTEDIINKLEIKEIKK